MTSKIEGIIFDLDGVLTDTSRFHYIAWKRIADELGIYFDEKINERLKGVDRLTSFEIILERSIRPFTSEEKEKFADQKNNHYLELIKNISPLDLYPGVTELLEQIKAKGIKLALGSASKNALAIIKKLEIEIYFDAVVDANKIIKGKPDPEIFITAADLLGLRSGRCAVLEDSAAGVLAARSAGMLAVGIGDKSILNNADLIYPNIKDVVLEDIINLYVR
jgi:beta-phosphoglucomutase